MAKFDFNTEEGMLLWKTLFEEIEGQSDRGAAIVALAWVEDAINVALESFLHSHQESWKRLFNGSGPLSNFSSKIDLCRLLGLITDTVRSDLHRLREIRNEFAHQIAHKTQHTKLDFSTPHIKDKCLALKACAHEKLDNPRHAFIRTCAILFGDFSNIETFGHKVSDGGLIFANSERHL